MVVTHASRLIPMSCFVLSQHTRMNLHKPKGGRAGTNRTLVLREDQLRHCGRVYNREQEDKKLAALWDEVCLCAPGFQGPTVLCRICTASAKRYLRYLQIAGRHYWVSGKVQAQWSQVETFQRQPSFIFFQLGNGSVLRAAVC